MAVRVTAPLVIAQNKDGSYVHLYEGAVLPDNLADGEAERLAEFFGDDEPASSDDKPAEKKAAAKKSASSDDDK